MGLNELLAWIAALGLMLGSPAVVIGATGGIGRAMVERIVADGAFETVWAVSRSGADVAGSQELSADLEDEASLASAAERIGQGPAPTLIVVATGVLHDGRQPERSFRQLDAEHLLRDYRVNAVGPALAAAGIGSFIAGCFGTLILAGFAVPLTEVAFKFGPAEYFSLMILGLIGAVVLASGSPATRPP